MQFGVVIPTYDDYGNAGVIRRLIGDAERLGYDSVWFGDHLIVPGYAVRQTDPHWYEALSCAILGIGLTQPIVFRHGRAGRSLSQSDPVGENGGDGLRALHRAGSCSVSVSDS